MKTFSLSHTVRTYPRLPYQKMKEDILGASYELSLVFVGKDKARSLNIEHRHKDYVPNVLSFPIEQGIGEIFICSEEAAREAASFDMTRTGYIGYLFIHGLLHLKGYDHGRTMDAFEKKYIAKYKLA
jgi:rRNA maturation RNase YbeY